MTSDGGAIDSPAAPSPSSAEQALRNLERLDAPKPRRVSRWDRPPPPHDWRWVVGGIGKALIVTGLLMFAFVAYQLWGTGIEYAQAQNQLENDFDELLAAVPTVAPTTEAPAPTAVPTTTIADEPAPTTTTTPAPPLPAFNEGDAMARIEIPSIGVDAVVVAGVQPDDLKKGPGHYPGTPMPGQLGNSAIAGHRTTYGQPFYRLDEVGDGGEIVLTTVQGRFVYRATGSEVVEPGASDVVATTDPTVATLTLTTCTPRYTASQRLVVYAELDTDASDRPQPAALDYRGRSEPTPTATSAPATTAAAPATTAAAPVATAPSATAAPPTDPPATVPPAASGEDPTITTGGTSVSDASADAFSHGWFSDEAAWPQVVLWGLACSAVVLAAYFLARSLRRTWVGVLVGCIPFVVALYFFFQNVNRLLPAAL